ncbi:RNase H domain protein [Xylaria sp. FL1777]|nr:RNase H domain protein [Xylaria sp. FL1777]
MLGQNNRGDTDRVFPTIFTPPSPTTKPTHLFPREGINPHTARYVHHQDSLKALVFTDGACLNNGKPTSQAGWAVVYGPGLIVHDHLENTGPFGHESIQTNNRAELRAVIEALRILDWPGECFNTLVIATDSEYVAFGATQWVKTWIENGWQTASNADVKNRDLWDILLGEVERWRENGLSVQFWRIDRAWNKVANEAAKMAAEQ